MTTSVYLVKGEDPILRSDAVDRLVGELLGEIDPTFALEDFTLPGRGESDEEGVGGAEARKQIVLNALQAAESPPFMTERRVVVLREIGNLTVADAEPFVRYLSNPMPTTVLVLVGGGGRLPTNLTKAGKGIMEEVGPTSADTADVLTNECTLHGLSLKPDATKLITSHIGDDAGRIPQIVATLQSAYGSNASLTVEDVEPYLGESGSIPIYQLTNAIEAGDVASALEVLNKLLNVTTSTQAKPMHPLQIMATLHNSLRRLLRLDDPSIRNEQDAVEAFGGKVKPYPAKKALNQSRALGPDGIRKAYEYLAQADLDMKGASGMSSEMIVEILVARLAGLSARSKSTRKR